MLLTNKKLIPNIMAPYLHEYFIYLLGLNLTLTGTFLGLANYLKVTQW